MTEEKVLGEDSKGEVIDEVSEEVAVGEGVEKRVSGGATGLVLLFILGILIGGGLKFWAKGRFTMGFDDYKLKKVSSGKLVEFSKIVFLGENIEDEGTIVAPAETGGEVVNGNIDGQVLQESPEGASMEVVPAQPAEQIQE